MLMTRPRPIDGESKRGYIIRLCESNELRGYNELVLLLDKRQAPSIDAVTIDELCELIDDEPDSFSGINFWSSKRRGGITHEYHGNVVHPPAVQKYFYRFCHQCLKEEPYVRGEWHLNHAPVCLKHLILLQDKCPVCRKGQSWDRATLTRCQHCNSSMLDAPSKRAGNHVVNMQKLILAKMQGVPASEEVTNSNPAFKWLEGTEEQSILWRTYMAYMDMAFGREIRWSYIVSPSVESSYEMMAWWFYSFLASPRFLTRVLGQFCRPLEEDSIDSYKDRTLPDLFDWGDDPDFGQQVSQVKVVLDEVDRYQEHFDAALAARMPQ